MRGFVSTIVSAQGKGGRVSSESERTGRSRLEELTVEIENEELLPWPWWVDQLFGRRKEGTVSDASRTRRGRKKERRTRTSSCIPAVVSLIFRMFRGSYEGSTRGGEVRKDSGRGGLKEGETNEMRWNLGLGVVNVEIIHHLCLLKPRRTGRRQ